jgi:hypothetical protein
VRVALENLIWWCVGHNVLVPERLFNWAARRKVERKGYVW